MSLIGFNARNHPQQRVRDEVDDRGTTPEDFSWFSQLGPFTLDVAAAAHNAKCVKFYTVHNDGLRQSWAGERVWCNPPYSNLAAWLEKAWTEHETTDGVAMLLPANRCEQVWWQRWVEPHRDQEGSPLRVPARPDAVHSSRRYTSGTQRAPPVRLLPTHLGIRAVEAGY